jgi:hypothetical protein
MKNLLKLVHLLAVVGFVGTLGVSLLLASAADTPSPGHFSALRAAIALVAGSIAVPSLLLAVISGLLLVVKQPALIEARWVWAKAALGVAICGVALVVVQPAVEQAAAFSREAALGSIVFSPLETALRREWIGGLVTLGLSLLAIVLAVWRPRLRRETR